MVVKHKVAAELGLLALNKYLECTEHKFSNQSSSDSLPLLWGTETVWRLEQEIDVQQLANTGCYALSAGSVELQQGKILQKGGFVREEYQAITNVAMS